MASEKRTSTLLKKLESGFFIAGVLLLASFLGIKAWSGSQSSAGISAFEEARASSVPVSVAAQAIEESVVSSGPVQFMDAPDTTLWSSERIQDYTEALVSEQEVPQGVLNIEHLNIRVPIYNGASEFNLNRGVARIVGTGRMGENGNLGIAGHRDGFFRPLKDIKIGDTFELETYSGTQVFKVSSIKIVDPSELNVLAPTDAPSVTLVTCYPFYFVGHAPKRFIVKGEVLDHQVNS